MFYSIYVVNIILGREKEKYDPSLELAFKIAELFEVKIEDIFQYRKN